MIFNASSLVIFLTVCGIAASSPDRAIDCRKFVFAPLCRGVAAKRGGFDNGNIERGIYIDGKSLKELLRNLYIKMGTERANEGNVEMMNKSVQGQEMEENVPKQHERNDALHKLLAISRQINSAEDNFPAPYYDNF